MESLDSQYFLSAWPHSFARAADFFFPGSIELADFITDRLPHSECRTALGCLSMNLL
jgi:hypothetical protein